MKTKKFRTNSKHVKELVKKHIFKCVFDYEDNEFKAFDELKKFVKSEFNRVTNYPYNLRKFPNEQERFSDYLSGLPFNFLFYYFDIKDFLNGLGINPEGKEYSNKKSLKLYHHLIYREIF